jgi:hypothetical protein
MGGQAMEGTASERISPIAGMAEAEEIRKRLFRVSGS